jgi:hypothetical protein
MIEEKIFWNIKSMPKQKLIEILRNGPQHFIPPRLTKQNRKELQRCVFAGLRSDQYGETMKAAVEQVGVNG